MIKFVLAVLTFLSLITTVHVPSYSQTTTLEDTTTPTISGASPQIVEIGIYPLSINDLDMARNSYFVDFYVWFKWDGDIDPLKTMRFVNMVDEWSTIRDRATHHYETLDDGRKYQIMRVEGRFIQPLDFRRFPFDEQRLDIIIEDEEHSTRKLKYAIDRDSSRLDRQLRIPGWDIGTVQSAIMERNYDTDFGITDLDTRYSSASFSVVIKRPASVFYWKLMTPLGLVLLASISSLLLPSRQIDAKITLVASGLLTAVFLQRLHLDSLPDISYLVIMDKIYIAAYTVIVICLLRVVYSFIQTQHDDGSISVRYRTLDMVVMACLLAFFVLVTAGLVATART